MQKLVMNIWTDLLSFFSLLSLMFTGAIIHFVLPPGSRLPAGVSRGGREFWGLGRHDWGDMHFYLAIAFCTLVLVHLVLHFAWIKGALKRLPAG